MLRNIQKSKFKKFIKRNLKLRYKVVGCILISFIFGLTIHSGYFSLWPLYRLRENIENIFTDKKPLFHSFNAVQNNKFLNTWDHIRFNYLNADNNLNEDELINETTKGLVNGLKDDFSYIEKIENKEQEKNGLIGVFIGYNHNNLVEISSLDQNGPAYKEGIRQHDIIVKVDGKTVLGKDIRTIKKVLRGEPNSNVIVTIFRENQNSLITKNIKRMENIEKAVQIKNIINGIYILKISSFTDDLSKRFDDVFKNINADNIKGIIIDLQNNPGGNVGQAIKIISNFLDKDSLILKKIDRDGTETIYTSEQSKYPFLVHIPKVILINSLSASCSEIMTLSLRDNQNIKIIGEKSFGKGVITDETRIDDTHILHLTIAKWYGPKGEYIHKTGIMPDIIEKHNIIEKALTLF